MILKYKLSILAMDIVFSKYKYSNIYIICLINNHICFMIYPKT
jgi:hypothetical protein